MQPRSFSLDSCHLMIADFSEHLIVEKEDSDFAPAKIWVRLSTNLQVHEPEKRSPTYL